MPDTSKVEVLFYKASSGAIFCLQGVGATLQIRFGDLLCKRLTCMTDCKANHFFPFMQATRCISFVGQTPRSGDGRPVISRLYFRPFEKFAAKIVIYSNKTKYYPKKLIIFNLFKRISYFLCFYTTPRKKHFSIFHSLPYNFMLK